MSEKSNEQFQGFVSPKENGSVTLDQDEAVRLESLPKDDSGKTKLGPLREFVKDSQSTHEASVEEIAFAIRTIDVSDPREIAEIGKKYSESLTIITDLHGMNDAKSSLLNRVAENPGEAVALLGDVLGSPQLDALQKLFYNSLINHAKPFLKNNVDPSYAELLSITGKNELGEEITLREGFKRVRSFERALEGKSPEEIEEEFEKLSDAEIAKEIKEYSKFVHYGHYASNLSEGAKRALVEDVKSNAENLIVPLRKIKDKNIPVVIIQGNWEAALPVDFVPGVEKAIRLPEEQRIFNVSDFFKEKGITYIDTLGTYESKSMIQVFVPFDISVRLGQVSTNAEEESEFKTELQGLKNQVESARKKGKQVVLISHAVPIYDIHSLPEGSPTQNQENIDATAGIQKVILQTIPDHVFYGHMHGKLKDKSGEETDNNMFRIVIGDDGNVVLDDGVSDIEGKRIIATYGRFAEEYRLKVPTRSSARKNSPTYFKKNSDL